MVECYILTIQHEYIPTVIMKDYYQILGVSKEATSEDIKKAYRKLAHKYHPDMKEGDEQKFKEINEAYQVLSDNGKRAQYDKFGRVFDGGTGPGADQGFGGFRWAWGQPGSHTHDDEDASGFGFDFQDVGDIFDEFFGGQQERRQEAKRGRDIEVELEIPLEATLTPTEQKISLSKLNMCDRCQGVGAEPGTKVNECFSCRGSGEVQQIKRTVFGSFTRVGICPECSGEGMRPDKSCNVCKGEGRIKGQEDIMVHIPAGVDTNQILRVEGKGDAGRKKGRNGDLYIRIAVKKHQIFQRRGDDILLKRDIALSQAALGDEIEVPTLEGTTSLVKIPEGAETGETVRVKGKGIPHFSGLGKGDMYVELKIQTPKKLSKEQKHLLQQLKEEGL